MQCDSYKTNTSVLSEEFLVKKALKKSQYIRGDDISTAAMHLWAVGWTPVASLYIILFCHWIYPCLSD